MPTTIMTVITPERAIEILSDGTERVTWEAPKQEPAEPMPVEVL